MRHRKDLTPVDFHLASRFKAYLTRYMQKHEVKRAKNLRQQSWVQRSGQWVPDVKMTDPTPALVIPLEDFRAMCRGIRREIEGCTEGRIVAALEKLSLLRYGKASHWKSSPDGETFVLLEYDRLAGTGTIQRRKADSKAEQLEQMIVKADEVAGRYVADGIPIDTAINAARGLCMVQAHEELCQAAKEAKKQRQEQVKRLIKRKI